MESNLTNDGTDLLLAGNRESTKPTIRYRFTLWLAIFLLTLSISLFLAGVILVLLVPAANQALGGYEDTIKIDFILLIYAILGTPIAIRHSKNPIGWIFSGIGLSGGIQVFAIGYLVFGHYQFPDSFRLPLYVFLFLNNIWVIRTALGPLAYLSFPDGKLLSSRWRFFAWFPVLLGVLMYLVNTPMPLAGIPASEIKPPIAFLLGGSSPRFFSTYVGVYEYFIDVMFIVAATSLVLRLRQSKGDLREQMKWGVYAGAVSVVMNTGLSILLNLPFIHTLEPGAYNQNMLFLGIPADISILIIPVAIFLAMSKYRLYEIDLVINRTLVYVPLTAILAGLYAASVTLLQRLFIASTGTKSDAAVVMSTLILAATFTPIKNKLQDIVDRRFKEPKDPLKALKAFGKQVEAVAHVLNPKHATHQLMEISMAAFQASCSAIYLTRDGEMVLEHASKDWKEGDGVLSLQLSQDGEQLGVLMLGARKDHKGYSLEDRKTLQREVDRVAEMDWLTQVLSQDDKSTKGRPNESSTQWIRDED